MSETDLGVRTKIRDWGCFWPTWKELGVALYLALFTHSPLAIREIGESWKA